MARGLVSAALFSVCLLSSNALAQTAVTAGATSNVAQAEARGAYAHGLAQQVLQVIKNPQYALNQKKQMLSVTFQRTMNMPWLAQRVAGPAWKGASPTQKQTFTNLYSQYLINSYLSALDEQVEQNLETIQIVNIKQEFEDAFVVQSQMNMRQGTHTMVDFVVQENAQGRHIIDIVVEGISMLHTHRAELGAMAQREGLGSVISKLERITQTPTTLSMRQ